MKTLTVLLCLLPLPLLFAGQGDSNGTNPAVTVVKVIKQEGNRSTKSQPGPSGLAKPDRAYLKLLKEASEVTPPTVTVIDKEEVGHAK